ncbi:protein NUCLEAR FUSION DEFECTIVE 6, chloroplastic/mitochondrial isoform X1 [Herrania umbratica]|uniref:Protein NUCLEAR FUSION DEFECTIVE 6, chloroplastic/mitochondrial isoform X1 n=1 Tax=Herrania umbratica TaxID=108875 RepID=A0A6J1AJU1_9ROSI|nr:protein NUCLEAR FUSION DEFECTIVE 6, chloroplastic/mitochondrial isoform X1 [Herrania umbratica]XP_021286852.1 protein NUCLEAR FUSION DEFECTIVE 6, chloroplastic/mitochondrial isoform X1 [Herrania umbratica]
MASFCRSAVMAGSRSLASRPKTLTLKSLTPKPMSSPFSSPSTRSLPCASRILSVLGGVESMMPLHSAIASARLQSSIAIDSSCWSWLSQAPCCPLDWMKNVEKGR